jgi:hypothetical protein
VSVSGSLTNHTLFPTTLLTLAFEPWTLPYFCIRFKMGKYYYDKIKKEHSPLSKKYAEYVGIYVFVG